MPNEFCRINSNLRERESEDLISSGTKSEKELSCSFFFQEAEQLIGCAHIVYLCRR